MKFFTVGVLLALGTWLIVPVKIFLLENVVTMLLPVEIFILDRYRSTVLGFIAIYVTQISLGLYSTTAVVLYGIFYVTLVWFYKIQVNLLAVDLKDLDKMWTGEVESTVAYRHAFLRNICIKRQDMNNYLDGVKELYSVKILLHFIFNYFSQIICLYHITINNWEGGYGVFFGLFFEMMFYCIMGTEISKSDDQLCFMISDTRWNEYDLISQRVILMLLKEAQVCRDMEIGFIGPLNLVTFVTIVKSMYSYYTVLTEML